jgi:hypothetical protein
MDLLAKKTVRMNSKQCHFKITDYEHLLTANLKHKQLSIDLIKFKTGFLAR